MGETVRLRDGRTITVPEHASIDHMLDHLITGRPVGEISGEAVEIWGNAIPEDGAGGLEREWMRLCREHLRRPR